MINAEAALGIDAAGVWSKAPLVLWLAQSILLLVDRRRAPLATWILLALMGGGASLWSWYQAAGDKMAAAWLASSVLAGLALLLSLRGWLPSGRLSSSPCTDDAGSTHGLHRTSRLGLGLIAGLGAVVTAVAITAPLFSSGLEPLPNRVAAGVHRLAAALAAANVLVCSLELTFYVAPRELQQSPTVVDWRWLTGLASTAFAVELLLCLGIFLSASDTPDEALASLLIIRLFGLSLLTVHFVAWMIPLRVQRLVRGSSQLDPATGATTPATTTATGWTSLTLAGWLAFLCLAAVCSLPSFWPWRELHF